MTIKPATYNLRIPQRATLRLGIKLPFSCVGKTLVAQVWNSEKRTTKYLDCTIEWIDQTLGQFDLVADRHTTELVTKDGFWDLLVIDDATDEADYWLEGKAILDIGLSDDNGV